MMHFQDEGDAKIQIGEESLTPLKVSRFENGRLSRNCPGTISTPDVRPIPHNLEIRLTLRGNVLNGYIAAAAFPPLYHFWLPSWTELRKQ